jgi:hypothetical protein
MVDNENNKWQENNYEGYGVFGGKDFFELLADMNGKGVTQFQIDERFAKGYDKTKEESRTDLLRSIGIDLYFGDEPFISPNLYEDSRLEWKNRTPEDCPNQGWT